MRCFIYTSATYDSASEASARPIVGHSSTLEVANRSHRTSSFLAALASYDTTVRTAVSFFTRAKLEVRILPRISLSLDTIAETPFLPGAQEALLQRLMLKVRNRSVKLGTKVRLNGTEPTQLNWNMPKRTYAKTGEVTIEPSTRYVEILEDDEIPVLVWAAWKVKEQEVVVRLNTDPPVDFRLSELKEPFIDMDVQFIPIDKKSRRFRLNLRSWDEFSLVEKN